MIYGAVHESRTFGNHLGYDIVAFSVKIPDIEQTKDFSWVSVYVTASQHGVELGRACEPTVEHDDVSALDKVNVSELILEAISDATTLPAA